MGFTERLFQSAFDRVHRKDKSNLGDGAVFFAPNRDRLVYLAASLSPLPIKLSSSDGASQNTWGYRQGHLFLPEAVDVSSSQEENYDALKFRLIIELLSIGSSLDGTTTNGSYSLSTSSAIPLHLELKLKEMALDEFVIGTRLHLASLAEANNKKSEQARSLLLFYSPDKPNLLSLAKEIETMNLACAPQDAAARDVPARLQKNKITETTEIHLRDADMNPLVHTFEKIHTLDDYTGGNKQIDPSDELNAHARALEDLELNSVVRTNQTGKDNICGEISRHSYTHLTPNKGLTPTVFQYDEWSEAKRNYLANWCRVQEHFATDRSKKNQIPEHLSMENSADCIQKGKEMSRRLAAFFNAKRWQPRQCDGTELDLDAIIDNRAELIRGGQPNDKNYQNLAQSELNFAITTLCDSSLSTDAWVGGKHVHGVVRDAAMMLSYALQGLNCQWSVTGFRSFTHDSCHYHILKDFTDHAEAVRKNLDFLTPDGYTRMGPAIRHAGFRLRQLKAKESMLIVVTDAKPTDYDHYEGSYGVNDVKRAISELKAKKIHTYAISISEKLDDQAARMFGHAMAQCTSSERLSELIFSFFLKFVSRK